MAFFKDTIFALSSGALPSGVAVVRVSGTKALSVLAALTSGPLPAPRQAALKTIRTRNNEIIDHGLLICFPSPASFTGEDCVEFQVHGGRAVVSRLLAELATFEGVRHAEAGEFSRRAFENGKADLIEMEGLADLISAETEMQRRLAMEQSSGGLSELYNGWAKRLTHARAMIEAELDFADEEDIPGSVSDSIWFDMGRLAREMDDHLGLARRGEIIRQGLKVVIAGAPNAGKSSLMNALAGSDLAIVTEIAGTTRDILHADIDIEGFLVRLFDTAGLRETDERIEQEGIRRAQNAIRKADIVLHLHSLVGTSEIELDFDIGTARVINVGTKSDLVAYAEHSSAYDVEISTVNGSGLDQLRSLLINDLRELTERSLSMPVRDRQLLHLRDAFEMLSNAVDESHAGLDVRSEYLRQASHSLGRITGRVDVENLLDVIFSEFCVGK